MQNAADIEKLTIDKTALSTKVAISRKNSDVSIRKIWIIQWANMR